MPVKKNINKKATKKGAKKPAKKYTYSFTIAFHASVNVDFKASSLEEAEEMAKNYEPSDEDILQSLESEGEDLVETDDPNA